MREEPRKCSPQPKSPATVKRKNHDPRQIEPVAGAACIALDEPHCAKEARLLNGFPAGQIGKTIWMGKEAGRREARFDEVIRSTRSFRAEISLT